LRTGLVLAAVCLATGEVRAQPGKGQPGEGQPGEAAEDDGGVTVRGKRPDEPIVEHRATDSRDKRAMNTQQPRSAPDALRYTPGVYVQQTGHAQGSPYIRGMTGRRTLLLFDGLRLNNALFRQGPNQYFFTVDMRSVRRIDVVRGAASVELGENAMGGAVDARPLEPGIDPYREGVHFTPRVAVRHATADREYGGRVQLNTQIGPDTGVLLGVGGRRVGQLEAAGPIDALDADATEAELLEHEVPRFEDDGRTQMGTGFDELTADARAVHKLSRNDRLVLATYVYRQFDAPRTDQCPPPEVPTGRECLVYEEQFRTHAYAKAELRPGWSWLDRVQAAASFMRQHEKRARDRDAFINGGRDDVNVWNLTTRAESSPVYLSDALALDVHYGLDGIYETVESAAWTVLVRSDVTRNASRGQYVDGSTYTRAAAWVSPRLHIGGDWTLRVGARGAYNAAFVPEEAESETRGVDRSWATVVGGGGVEYRPWVPLTMMANVEQGYRAPNLDDLSARQLTGQGRQVENPDLDPERSVLAELGVRLTLDWIRAEAWIFQTWLFETMERRDAECRESDRECRASRRATPVQLVNLSGTSIIRGAEGVVRLRPGLGVEARATVSYAWGEGDSPLPAEPDATRPLSRVPPLNGTVELTWRDRSTGLYAGGASRWATDQDRLSFGDLQDSRIPPGGTPGYTVVDLRGGIEVQNRLNVNLVLENIFDTAYRVHGSSVNGPGRGAILNLEAQL
jgi:iron complex outermembrane receptor protein/hemoglobin/transferrin/lactoferrin receptor protein